MKRFIKENSLSIVLFGLFFAFLAGLMLTGFLQENEELAVHGQAAIGFGAYIASGSFVEAVFENWESEFLQMGALVVLTIWLVQKGSADSKRLRGKEAVDTEPHYSWRRAKTWRQRGRVLGELLYANSLSIALFLLFFLSMALHAVGGVAAANQEAQWHGEPTQTVWQYIGSSQFWFESFQNWQSEFLAVGLLLVLSIFLRQRGSPESKPISDPDGKTGS